MTARRWPMLGLCFFGIMINYIDRSNFALALPLIDKELHFGPAMSGLLLSAFFWLYTVALVPIGWLSDRFGIRIVYATCMIAWSLISMSTGLVGGVAGLLALRLLMGLAEAGSFPTNAIVVARWFPRAQRGLASSIWHSGIGIGSALAFPIVVTLIAAYGWRISFAGTGMLGVICGFVWLIAYRDPTQEEALATQGSEARNHARIPTLSLLTCRPAVAMSLGFFLVNFVNFFFLGWFPSYLLHERGVNLRELAYLGPMPTIAAIAGGLLGGVVADALFRRGWSITKARKTCLIGGLVAACLVVAAAMTANLYLAIGLFSLSFAGISFTSANIQALPPEMAPSADQVGTISGFQMIGGAVSGIISNIIIGGLVEWTGSYIAPLAMLAVLAVLAMLNYAFLLGPVQPLQIVGRSS